MVPVRVLFTLAVSLAAMANPLPVCVAMIVPELMRLTLPGLPPLPPKMPNTEACIAPELFTVAVPLA